MLWRNLRQWGGRLPRLCVLFDPCSSSLICFAVICMDSSSSFFDSMALDKTSSSFCKLLAASMRPQSPTTLPPLSSRKTSRTSCGGSSHRRPQCLRSKSPRFQSPFICKNAPTENQKHVVWLYDTRALHRHQDTRSHRHISKKTSSPLTRSVCLPSVAMNAMAASFSISERAALSGLVAAQHVPWAGRNSSTKCPPPIRDTSDHTL